MSAVVAVVSEPVPLEVGAQVAPFEVQTLSHGQLRVPSGGLLHLQFQRFAGCPICNLHMKSFAQGLERLRASGVQTVAFFHSSAESMRPFQGDLPFPVVPDPEQRLYRQFSVGRSALAALHPSAMWAAMKGMLTAPANPLRGEGGTSGLPADFLLGPDGRVLAVHYGDHANDLWSVEQVLELARRP
jgi:peroxiredoxin